MPRKPRKPLPALSTEDLLSFRFVSDPQISPDGERVLFVLTGIDEEKDRYLSHLWIVPADGSGLPRQLTFGAPGESLPRWSPDGAWIAFLAARGEGKEKQLHLLPAGGPGEARQLTALEKGLTTYAWAPDSLRLAFVSRGDKSEEEKRPDRTPPGRAFEGFPTKFNAEGIHWDDIRAQIYTTSVEDEAPARVTRGAFRPDELTWSPDGEAIAFTQPADWRDYGELKRDLFSVPAAGGRIARLTRQARPVSHPCWTLDGRWLLFLGKPDHAARNAASTKLWRVPAAGGEARLVPGQGDLDLGQSIGSDTRYGRHDFHLAFARESGRVLCLAESRGRAQIGQVSLRNGAWTPLTEGDRAVTSFTASRDGHVAFTAGTATSPEDVYVLAPDLTERRLTGANHDLLSQREVSRPQEFTFASSDGLECSGWVLPPPGHDGRRRVPAVLEIHGGPHTAYGHAFAHEFQALAGKGYAVIYLNPRGSTGYGQAFTAGVVRDYGGMDYADLMAGVDAALEFFPFLDARRLGVTGGSYGGFMTNWIVTRTNRFKGAITRRSISNWISMYGTSDIGPRFTEDEVGGDPWAGHELLWDRSPIRHVDRVRTPLLIIHADEDHRCPVEQAEQLFSALRRRGRTCRFLRFPGENHELTRSGTPSRRLQNQREILAWLDRHVRKA